MGRKEAFYNPIIRSQSVGEPVALDCEFQLSSQSPIP